MQTVREKRGSQRPVSLWPREHGAYVQLLMPLVCALLFAPRSLLAVALAVAASCAFCAHEPLLLLLGRRGEGVRQRGRKSARVRLTALSALSLGVALWAALTDKEVALALSIPAALSLGAFALVLLERERTLPGQLLSAAALASFAVPVLVAASLSLPDALRFSAGWLVVHVTATCVARAYVYRRREGQGALYGSVALALSALAVSAGLSAAGALSFVYAIATLPFALLVVLLALDVLRFKSPKMLGWVLTSANLVAFVAFGLELI